MPGSEFELRADDGQTPSGAALAARRASAGGVSRSRTASPSTAPATRGSPPRSTPRAMRSTPSTCAATGPAAPADLGHFADADGWAKGRRRPLDLNRLIAAEQPGVPIVFLGHSMGSFLGRTVRRRAFGRARRRRLFGLERQAAADRDARSPDRARRAAAARQARQERAPQPDDVRRLQQAVRAGAHRLRLAVARRPEVDAYVADPLCGFPFTTQLAIDLLDALPSLSSPQSLARDPQGPADLRLFRRARPGRRQHPGPDRRPRGARASRSSRPASIRARATRR